MLMDHRSRGERTDERDVEEDMALVVYDESQVSIDLRKAKALKERALTFRFRNPGSGEEEEVVVRVRQDWNPDDAKGGTEIGFGACVYPAAICLSRFVERNPQLVKGKRVLELGCGVGLVSIVCKLAGASFCDATDGDSKSLELSMENLNRNLSSLKGGFRVRRFLWGSHQVRDVVDVVIASDIVACPYHHALNDLVKTFQDLFAMNERMYGVLAYQSRARCELDFFENVKQAGISCRRVENIQGVEIYFLFKHEHEYLQGFYHDGEGGSCIGAGGGE